MSRHSVLPVLCQLAILSLLALIASPATAQVTSGTLYGTVKDPSGAYVSNARVTVHSDTVGAERTVTTNDRGDFVVPNMPPSTYTLTIDAQGFKKTTAKGIVLSAADKLNAGEYTLQVGGTAETVTVAADAGQLQLQSESGERSDVITDRQIKDLALNGRNILEMVKVVPGVVSNIDGSQAGRGNLDQFNINGTRGNQHEYTIDGTSNVDTGNNGAEHVTLNPDAVAEVKVLTSNYQAEFGKAAGGQVIVSTKSGTNQWHGNGRFFHRHEQFNANEWFNKQAQGQNIVNGKPENTPPKYRYNYAGYQLGGPIKKDKLYFFFGQEYYRQLLPSGTSSVRVPTQAEINGDFSQSFDSSGNLLVIYDPNTGQPFPGNKIDPTQLTAAQQSVFSQVQKVLSLFPQPNVSGIDAYNRVDVYSVNNPRREDYLRIDYQLNNSNRLFGRWIHNSSNTVWPLGNSLWGGYGNIAYPGGIIETEPGWDLALNLTTTITPTLLNELSFGPSVSRTTFGGSHGNISRGVNGITLPLLYPVDNSTPIPDMSFNGASGVNWAGTGYLGALPWFQANTTINVNDNLTKVLDKHTLKFGMFYQRSRKDQPAWGNYNGQFNFDSCITSASVSELNCDASSVGSGNPYASALLGAFRGFDQTSSRPRGFFRYNQLEFYAQDTWKATSRLTLDYGVRFAWIPPQYDAKNQVAVFNPALYDPSQAVRIYNPAVGGGVYDPGNPGNVIQDPFGILVDTVVPGSGNLTNGFGFASAGYPKGGWNDRGIMPEPRFGFAYDLLGTHRTVLRGGFGTAHDRIQGNQIFNPVFSNPNLALTPSIANNNATNLPALASSGAISPLGNVVAVDRKGQVPVVYSYSLGIQHEIANGTTLDIAYVGTLSRHLSTIRNVNQVPLGTAFTRAAQDPTAYGGTVPAVEPNLPTAYANAGYSFAGDTVKDARLLDAYPNLSYYSWTAPPQYMKFDGTANYNSLQVSAQRRFSHGLTFGAAYTWSKALTTASSDGEWVDSFNSRLIDYRAADFDRRHVLAINYVYDLPNVTKHFSGPKWLSYVTDNFQVDGFVQAMSGAPLPQGGGTAGWAASQQWNGTIQTWQTPSFWLQTTSDPNHSVSTSKFDPNAFVLPPIGPPQRGERNLYGGAMQAWTIALLKNFPLGNEARYLQLRLEAFNVFNHPNFQDLNMGWNISPPSGSSPATLSPSPGLRPAGQSTAGNYGSFFGEYNDTYTGNGGPRVIQLGVKLYF